MNWKLWLKAYAPLTWTVEEKLEFIQYEVPQVTMDDVLKVLNE